MRRRAGKPDGLPRQSNAASMQTSSRTLRLRLPPRARATHTAIISTLRRLEARRYESCRHSGFKKSYSRFLGLFERFQREAVSSSKRTVTCRSGCARCCFHWVADVNSFETEMIAECLQGTCPSRIPRIVEQCRDDIAAFEELERAAAQRGGHVRSDSEAGFEQTDRLLEAFYRLRRPCPLLTAKGECSIYALRPLTCRIYFSFSPPDQCDPAYTDDNSVPTVMVDLEEEPNAILDELHCRYDRLGNDTELRSVLVKRLGT